MELAERRRRPNGQRRTWGWDKIRIRQLSSGNLGGRGRLEPACPLAAMPSDAVPILVPGPKVQHGVLSLQTAHANEAAYADGRRGFESMDYPYLLCMTDIFEAEPWLLPVVQTGGPIDDFYRYAGHMEPCDQPLRIKSGKILVRKMAAIHHALRVAKPDATILWYAPHALCWRARCTLLIPSSS